MNKVILLDRDGIINHDSLQYIKSPDEFNVIPENVLAIAKLSKAGYKIGVATNQSGVSRGLYTEKDLVAIHSKMLSIIEKAEGHIDALEYCIHMPDAGCSCRKPQPGMLLALAKHFNCDLQGIPYVGDRVSDIEAAIAAGATPILVLSNMTDLEALKKYPQVPAFQSLMQYVNSLLHQS
ncbi:D-glycero-beta-D-manno-heptose 1,7-bisphosphate 7-phosphatase [Legionella waltersii]|uniref:D,D-heptose 1,7-bisphosphate phosphatase n=1 Tax=Legionella waltersii TaxID=66969 RepID=A0A0W1A1M1_9GAMM|nr:D-glycero-beta-D-manno-heptose 1,7-bisphosphate 7-phosphatase [Legionella waltersii]KTD75243.1 D,D-heptose 1,7-bisphosphate phosphatase [Legionella waltersii]SNV06675.1 D,D-heptose 1,7-bisphosphate phosphatase [Legionella waltersii]